MGIIGMFLILSVFSLLAGALEYGLLSTRGKWRLMAIAPPLLLAAAAIGMWTKSNAAIGLERLESGLGFLVVVLPGLAGTLLALAGWWLKKR